MKGQRHALPLLGFACLLALVGLLYAADLAGLQERSLASAPVRVAIEGESRASELACTEPITVGVITDLTGPLAAYGEHIARSFPLGMEYVAGPPVEPDVYMVDGCELRLLWGDDQSYPDQTAAIAHEMIEAHGARILVGTVSSGATATLQQIAADYNVLLIVAPAAASEITGANFNDNTFRVSRSNYQDAVNLCEYLGQGAKLVQIAPDYAWGWGMAAALRDACRFFGGSFVAEDIFAPADTTNFTPYAQQIANSGADACLVTWAGGGLIPLFQALADEGVVDQMEVMTTFVTNPLIPVFFPNIVGEPGGTTYHYTFPINPINDWLTTEIVARYGEPPDLFYADGMNAALLVVEALRATGFGTDAATLIAAMEGMSFDGPKGEVVLRAEDHVAMQDMYVATLLNVDDPEYRFFGLLATARPVSPCLLPEALYDRCGDLPIGTLVQPIYVDVDATGNNDGTTWEDAYTALQPALDSAGQGYEIWVAAGTYTPTYQFDPEDPRSATFQLKNGVALYGGFDPTVGDVGWGDRDWANNETTLSGDIGVVGDTGDNSYHVFYHPQELALDATAILDGFTVTDSFAYGDSPSDPNSQGGGMYNYGSSPTVANCTFSYNRAMHSGGGMYNYDSSPAVTNCAFSDGFAFRGGGIFNESSAPAVTNCTFSDNEASNQGGGMANISASSPTVTNCTFTGNSAYWLGGGMFNNASSPEVSSCAFWGNWVIAARGGGMSNNSASSPVVANCIFSGNSAFDSGGGMANWSSSPTVISCAFSDNSAQYGGGMSNSDSSAPAVTNCTFLDNTAQEGGGGLYNKDASSPVVTNCILRGDSPEEIFDDDSQPAVTYSDVQGGYEGTGNIDADPLFVDPGSGDYHLSPGSPCIDAGTNDAPNLPDIDFEGDPRVMDGNRDGTAVVDMGVDEVYGYRLHLPLIFRSY